MEESAERKSGVFVVGFPVSLRSDLAYCRNALKDYIKVHQVKICHFLRIFLVYMKIPPFSALYDGVDSTEMGKN